MCNIVQQKLQSLDCKYSSVPRRLEPDNWSILSELWGMFVCRGSPLLNLQCCGGQYATITTPQYESEVKLSQRNNEMKNDFRTFTNHPREKKWKYRHTEKIKKRFLDMNVAFLIRFSLSCKKCNPISKSNGVNQLFTIYWRSNPTRYGCNGFWCSRWSSSWSF